MRLVISARVSRQVKTLCLAVVYLEIAWWTVSAGLPNEWARPTLSRLHFFF